MNDAPATTFAALELSFPLQTVYFRFERGSSSSKAP